MTIRTISLYAACLAVLGLAATAPGAWAQTAAQTATPTAAAAKPAANGKSASAPAKSATASAKPASAPAIVIKPAASAPVPVSRQTRPLTSAEKLESVAPPGELRPERIVTPQLSIPLGKNAPDAAFQNPRKAAKPSGAEVNDSAGRCAAIADENERAMCREKAGLGKPKP